MDRLNEETECEFLALFLTFKYNKHEWNHGFLFIFSPLSSYDGDKDGGRMELWETNPKSWRLFWRV